MTSPHYIFFLIFFRFYTNGFEAEDIRNYFTLKKDNIYGIHIDYNNVILPGYNRRINMI